MSSDKNWIVALILEFESDRKTENIVGKEDLSNEFLQNLMFLARLFSEKTWGIAIALVSSLSSCKNLWHFVISLSLLNIYTWNSRYVFTMEKGICKIKGDNAEFIFARIIPFLDFEFDSNVTRGHTIKIKSSYNRTFSPAWGAFVKRPFNQGC